jgi:hypothetical protein
MSGNTTDRTLTQLAKRTRFAQTIRSGRLRGVRAVLRVSWARSEAFSEALLEKADELIFVGVAQAAEFW